VREEVPLLSFNCVRGIRLLILCEACWSSVGRQSEAVGLGLAHRRPAVLNNPQSQYQRFLRPRARKGNHVVAFPGPQPTPEHGNGTLVRRARAKMIIFGERCISKESLVDIAEELCNLGPRRGNPPADSRSRVTGAVLSIIFADRFCCSIRVTRRWRTHRTAGSRKLGAPISSAPVFESRPAKSYSPFLVPKE